MGGKANGTRGTTSQGALRRVLLGQEAQTPSLVESVQMPGQVLHKIMLELARREVYSSGLQHSCQEDQRARAPDRWEEAIIGFKRALDKSSITTMGTGIIRSRQLGPLPLAE